MCAYIIHICENFFDYQHHIGFMQYCLKGDLKIQAGAKHVLDALHPDAHEAFNSSRNIEKVLDKVVELRLAGTPQVQFLTYLKIILINR